jgi:RNA polymerase sigma-70 factor (ECF subfamily)
MRAATARYGGAAMTGKRPMPYQFPVVPKALRKKQSEFEAEAVPHMDILYNFALRTTGNSDDAQDLLQETLLKAYRFWDKYEKGTNIRAWLFRIMKNSYINRYRKEMREPGMVDYEDVENFYDSIRDDSTDTNDLQKKLYSNMLSDEVTKALQSLPEDFRTVVILCDIEGLTYEEIAEFLNCPIGTVRSRLHRGRKMLQEKLFDYARERGLFDDEDSLD